MNMEYDAALMMSENEEYDAEPYISEISESDLGQLAVIWKRFTLLRYPDNHPDPDGWIEQTSNMMSRGIYLGLKISSEGHIIGFVDGAVMYEPSTSNITFMGRHSWVEPEYRGKNLGRALYLGIIAEAREARCVDVQIISPYTRGADLEHQLERNSMPNKMHQEIGNGRLEPMLIVMQGKL